MLFQLTYRHRGRLEGTGLLECADKAHAEKDGHRICDEQGWQFYHVRPAILNAPEALPVSERPAIKKPAA
jgi:hypothetical protein